MLGRVLLVDDDSNNRLLLSLVLKKHSTHLFSAESGQEALAILAASAIETAFIDIELPDMHGLAVLKAVRLHAPTALILMTTAADAPTLLQQCCQAGANIYLVKPFDVGMVADLLAGWAEQDWVGRGEMLVLDHKKEPRRITCIPLE